MSHTIYAVKNSYSKVIQMRTLNRYTQTRERPVFISGAEQIEKNFKKFASVLRRDGRYDLEVPENVSPTVFMHGSVKARAVVESRKERASNPNAIGVDEAFPKADEEPVN